MSLGCFAIDRKRNDGMLVSVIMSTYNCGKYILQSLDSVIEQTIDDWEVQIVDD